MGITEEAETTMNSAYPPNLLDPTIEDLGQNSVFPERQYLHCMHVTLGFTRTLIFSLRFFTSLPTSTISPDTSAPRTCGPSKLIVVPLKPALVYKSNLLRAQALTFILTSEAPIG